MVAGHQSGQYGATATRAPSMSIASVQSVSAMPSSRRHSGAMRKAGDGELDIGEVRGAGQLPGEVAGVGA